MPVTLIRPAGTTVDLGDGAGLVELGVPVPGPPGEPGEVQADDPFFSGDITLANAPVTIKLKTSNPSGSQHRVTVEIGGTDVFAIQKNGSELRFGMAQNFGQTGSGFFVDTDRIWTRRGIIAVDFGDGNDMAMWRTNGAVGALTDADDEDMIGALYWSAMGGSVIIPTDADTPLYTSYDGVNQHTVTGGTEAGPYSFAAVSWNGASAPDLGDVAVTIEDPGLDHIANLRANKQVKDTDYTVNVGAKTITFIAGHEPTAGEVVRIVRGWNRAGEYGFLGRSGSISCQLIEEPDADSRGAAVIHSVTMPGEIVPRPRAWLARGSYVWAGRAVYEDVSGAEYPDNKRLEDNWLGNLSIAVNPKDYVAPAGFVWLASDIASQRIWAIRKTADPTDGFDVGYHHSNERLVFERVVNGTRTVVGSVDLNGQRWSLGGSAGEASRAYVDIDGQTAGTAPKVAAKSSGTNEDISIEGKGTGGVKINNTAAIKGVLTTTTAIDFGSIAADGVELSSNVTVTGALTSDMCLVETVNDTLANASLFFAGRVTAADTVVVRCFNNSGSPIDPSSQTVRIVLLRF